MLPDKARRRPLQGADVHTAAADNGTTFVASAARHPLPGWNLMCPVCWRRFLPADGLLHLQLAPRFAHHLWDEHPYEAAVLRLHLTDPPAEWPVLEAA